MGVTSNLNISQQNQQQNLGQQIPINLNQNMSSQAMNIEAPLSNIVIFSSYHNFSYR